MKTKWLYIILLGFEILCCQTTAGQVLYEISGNSSHAKSYLLATNRLVNRDFLDTIPNVYQVFGKCRRVVTEFAMQDYEALAALRQAAKLPDSVALKQFYSEREYAEMDETLQLLLGAGWEQFGRMRPSFLTELCRTELMRKWLGFSEQQSMETFFEQIALQQQIPVIGLDGIGETMYMLFEREPMHWQCEELKKVLYYPEREIKQQKAICSLYKQGHLNGIVYQIISPDNTSTFTYSDYQVYAERNKEWCKRLTPYLKEGKTFITLNAVYLGGEKGLIACLKNNGYRVRAVNRGRFKE